MLGKPIPIGTELVKTALERGVPLHQVEEIMDAAENRHGRGTHALVDCAADHIGQAIRRVLDRCHCRRRQVAMPNGEGD